MRLLPFFGLALPLAACVATQPAEPLDDATRTLLIEAADRAAWGDLAGLVLEGEAALNGRTEALRLVVLPDGSYRREIAGPLGSIEVFDGTRAWRRDRSGLGRELSLGAREDAPLMVALRTGLWLEDPSLVVEVLEPDRLRVTRPGTPLDFQLLLDPTTKLPHQVHDRSAAGDSVATFSDWRDVAGVPFAFDLTIAGASGETTSYLLDGGHALDAARAAEPGLLAPPTEPPVGVHFDPDGPGEVEVFRARSGHLFVRPRLAGEDVGWFIFDSGAGAMVIDSTIAADLGLEELGRVLAVGVGASQTTRFVGASSFGLGALSWDDVVLVELDLAFLGDLLGVPVAGIVGYELFGRAVLDLEAGPLPTSPGDLDGDGEPDPAPALARGGRLGIHAPGAFEAPADAGFARLIFEGHSPCVEASFPTPDGPVTRWFRLDTGANGSVTFHAPAVVEHRLLANRDTRLAAFGGIGGRGSGYLAELEWFELGGRRFEAIEATFATTEVGTFSDPYTAGNIGQELLEPFRILFDYPHDRLALVPR